MTNAKVKSTKKAKAAKPELREPTAREALAIAAAQARDAKRSTPASLTMVRADDGALSISNPHSDPQGWIAHVADTFGSRSDPFFHQSFKRICNVLADKGKVATEEQANGALAILSAIAPQNELETIIGEQIIACHMASLDFMSRARLNAGEYRDSANIYANMATKASRTMAAHIDALAKLRSGGKQVIQVVHVNGPAVVGDNAQTIISGGVPGDGDQNITRPDAPAALAHIAATVVPPMWGEDPERITVPRAGGEGAA